MATPFPFESASAWDRITIAGVAYSGLARVEGAKRARKVDVPKRSGADGASLIIKHRELAEPKITLVGWTPEHLAEMNRIVGAVFPSARVGQHDPVTAEHPALVFHAIEKVFVHDVEGPKPQDDGTFELTLMTHEWRPPPPTNAARRPNPSAASIADAAAAQNRAAAREAFAAAGRTPPSWTAEPRRFRAIPSWASTTPDDGFGH